MSATTKSDATVPTPPVANRQPHAFSIHGRDFVDDYHWMRQKESDEVIAHLEAENTYTTAMLSHTEDLQEDLYNEFVGRIKQSDTSVPVEIDGYFYYSRTEEEKQYKIYCRRSGSMASDEEVLLDLNAKAEEAKAGYVGLGVYAISHDHRLMAYSLDLDGSELYTIRIRNLETGEDLDEEITGTYYSFVWGTDNRSFLYTMVDEAHRSDKIMRHNLGTPIADDRVVYHDPDELFRVGVGQTKDDRFAILVSQSSETSESHLLPLDDLDAAPIVVEARRQGHLYDVDHRNATLYILTNHEAPDFRLMTAPVATPGIDHWKEMVPTEPDVLLEGIDLFDSFLALYRRAEGLTGVRIFRFSDDDSTESHDIVFPEPTFLVHSGGNPQSSQDRLRLVYMSMTTPQTTYDYDPVARELHLMKQKKVLGGFNPLDYRSERVMAESDDGTLVPISLVYRIDTFRQDGSNPGLLYGYGSYGINLDPFFSSTWLSLLDRGFVCAIEHIRGGQELGRRWYDEGKLRNKQNTFTDFIAAARHLVGKGYTGHDRMVIQGGSAGGLLIGAVINRAPDVAAAAIAQVPFVDVINTMLDASLPLTVGEYEEWGNPNEAEAFDNILAYSPYDNVTAQRYPDLLITAGLNDPRVQYWEPAKWTAKLREHADSDGLVLLKTNMGAGHGGASGRYDLLRETAFEYAFMIDRVGNTD